MVMQNVEKGTCKVSLHIPKFEELSFRQELYADKDTMNFGDEPFEFSFDKWQAWFDKWVKNPEKRFYAYIVSEKTGEPVGDVNYHLDERFGCFLIGVVILAKLRGQGFAQEGFRLLCEKAKEDGVKELCNFFPRSRESAIHIHKKLGFVEVTDKGTESDIFLRKSL